MRLNSLPFQPQGVRCLALLALALLLGASLAAASSPAPPSALSVGETLTYQMHWGFFPVGQTQISTGWEQLDGRRVLAIRFTAKSNRLVETLYPVNDLLVSYVDPATFLPIRLVKKTSEGRVLCDDVLDFDRENLTARWTDYIKDKTVEYPIEGDTQDVVSFMYSMRALPLEVGQERTVHVAADEKLQTFNIRALKSANITLPNLGRIASILVKVTVASEGFFVRKIPGDIWVSQDDRHIVTRLYVKVPVGWVRVSLAAIESVPVE